MSSLFPCTSDSEVQDLLKHSKLFWRFFCPVKVMEHGGFDLQE